MYTDEMIDFPEPVSMVLQEIEGEANVNSIWFIGSRANGSYSEGSDWDFICFIDGDVSEKPKRQSRFPIDIIQVDSKGKYLLEGETKDLMGDFENWHWKNANEELAYYKSRITPPVDVNGSYNIEDVKIVKLKAHKVCRNNA